MPETMVQITDPPRALRVVLLGLPEAGKSSLLGALAQAAQTQGKLLGQRLIDRGQGLEDLRKKVYDKGPAPTQEEMVAYQVYLEGTREEVLLYDCAGRAAADLLMQGDCLDTAMTHGELAGAIGGADSLILVVDAAGDAAHLDKTFGLFGQFLHGLEEMRSQRSDVVGLPVYLVLTKCDLLAKKTDTAMAWMQRIEARKGEVARRFREFIERAEEPGPAFGQIDLHLWATATGRPVLADRAAKPQEPYAVAELFRQALSSAQGFVHRRHKAGFLLQVTVAGAAALVGLLIFLALLFFATRPDPVLASLENEIRMLVPPPAAKPAQRFKEPLADKLKKLRKIKDNPDFPRLSQEVQLDLVRYLSEIETYQIHDKEFLAKVPNPQDATSEKDLKDTEKALEEWTRKLPADFRNTWLDTKIASRAPDCRAEIQLLRDVVAQTEKWLVQQQEKADALRKDGLRLLIDSNAQQRTQWLQQIQDFTDQAILPPSEKKIARHSSVTYATVYNFDQIIKASADFETELKKLQRVGEDVRQEKGNRKK